MNPLLAQLLLAIGGSLGASLVKNPQLQTTIATAVTASQNLINILVNKGSTSVAAPVFMTVLQAAIAVLVAERKITTDEAAAFNDAVAVTLAADQAGQMLVDPGTLTPIALLP